MDAVERLLDVAETRGRATSVGADGAAVWPRASEQASPLALSLPSNLMRFGAGPVLNHQRTGHLACSMTVHLPSLDLVDAVPRRLGESVLPSLK